MYVMVRVTIIQFLVMEAVKAWISSCASLEINVTVIGTTVTMKSIVMMALMRVELVKPGRCSSVKWVLHTVTVLWKYNLRCILGVFVVQNFCLHELWKPHSFRIYSQAFDKSKIHQPSLEKLQFEGSKIEAFLLDFWGKMLKIKQNCFNLAPFKLLFFKSGLMNFSYLKGCWSGRLGSIFWCQVASTVHADKSFEPQKLPKYT